MQEPGASAPRPFVPERWAVVPVRSGITAEKGDSFGKFTLTGAQARDGDSAAYAQYRVWIPASDIAKLPNKTLVTFTSSVAPVNPRGSSASSPSQPLHETNLLNNTETLTWTIDRPTEGRLITDTTARYGRNPEGSDPDAMRTSPGLGHNGVVPPNTPYALIGIAYQYLDNTRLGGQYESVGSADNQVTIEPGDPAYQRIDPRTARLFVKTSDIPGDPYPKGMPGETANGYYEIPKSDYDLYVRAGAKGSPEQREFRPLSEYSGDFSDVFALQARPKVNNGNLLSKRTGSAAALDRYHMYLTVQAVATSDAVFVDDGVPLSVSMRSKYQGRSQYKGTGVRIFVAVGEARFQASSLATINPDGTVGNRIAVAKTNHKYRYTVRPETFLVPNSPHTTAAHAQVLMCLPAEVVDVDLSPVDATTWKGSKATDANLCADGRTPYLFDYVANGGKLPVGQPLPEIPVNLQVGPYLPESGQLNLDSYFRGDDLRKWYWRAVIDQAGWQAQTSTDVTMVLVAGANYLKTLRAPNVQRNEPVSYLLEMYNTTMDSMGHAIFVDELPYVGDGRGTTVTPVLTGVERLQGEAANVRAEYTTAPHGTIGAAPAAGVTWQEVTAATDLSQVTALRFVINDFATGPAGGARYALTLEAPQAEAGAVIANTMTGQLRTASHSPLPLTAGEPQSATVVAATVSGRIAVDINDDGASADDTALAGATVRLLDASTGAPVLGPSGAPLETTAAADGTYSFNNVLAGNYRISVTPPVTDGGASYVPSYSPAGKDGATSAAVTVERAATLEGQDFGFFHAQPALTLTKAAALAADGTGANAAAGDTVTYTFTVTNTGNVPLAQVALSDPKVSGLVMTWPDAAQPGMLAPGAVATGTAQATLTQADIDAGRVDNTATVTGTSPHNTQVQATATVTTPLPAAGALTVSKTATPPATIAAGEHVRYSIDVRNTGNVTLSGVTITDPLLGGELGTIATLAPGASQQVTGTYTLTQADIDRGTLDNTATATGTDPRGTAVSAQGSVTVSLPEAPALAVTKTATPPATIAAGEQVHYRIAVRNTGNVTLHGIIVNDPLLGGKLATITTLAPGASGTVGGSYTLTQADIDRGTLENTATAAGASPHGTAVEGSATVTTPLPGTGALRLVKTATPPAQLRAGEQVEYIIEVSNSGNVTLSGVTIADPLLGGELGTIATLAPGASQQVTGTYTLTQADIDRGTLDNTATATGTDPRGVAVTASDSATVSIPDGAQIQVIKQGSAPARPAGTVRAGDEVTWTFTIANRGTTTLSEVALRDELPGLSAVTFGEWPGAAGVLAPGQSVTASATSHITQELLDAGAVENTVEVSATSARGLLVRDSATETVLLPQCPGFTLVKTGSVEKEKSRAGDLITWFFTLENTGNTTLRDLVIQDDFPGLSEIEYSWPGAAGVLAPGEKASATATSVLTQEQVDAGTVRNDANATGVTPGGDTVTNKPGDPSEPGTGGHGSVTITGHPGMVMEKTATVDGDVIVYRFEVLNTGTTTLTGITIDDPMSELGPIEYTWPRAAGVLAPGEKLVAQARAKITATMQGTTVTNTATVTAVTPSGEKATPATASVDTKIPPAPPVRKQLSHTGAELAMPIALAILLLAGGGALRRREKAN
ncbi:hypothetical protein QP431_07255 [Actinotignum sanguinis]|uniref:DUF7507 domain-containing protein n=1 Tax=Actinotignum sanguinis TaxID=1445614 RepID=UPI00237E1695|nr:hypothetical protein [Actinotignum sanguinis]MDE1553153.1 hypothetical protein [Actinotignum sanguinis]MDE1566207.1 hypothetical protein [Actinotignum sanguinis]MDE1577892.1 hypothetical protein [Actinotignum sanguinis]MDK7197999.1 hypothetical protein [Actinotignum sanguinis]MDK8286967.1 hypothetical protein [Actinotignum sanguinis]